MHDITSYVVQVFISLCTFHKLNIGKKNSKRLNISGFLVLSTLTGRILFKFIVLLGLPKIMLEKEVGTLIRVSGFPHYGRTKSDRWLFWKRKLYISSKLQYPHTTLYGAITWKATLWICIAAKTSNLRSHMFYVTQGNGFGIHPVRTMRTMCVTFLENKLALRKWEEWISVFSDFVYEQWPENIEMILI